MTTKTVALPQPGYPMLTRTISNTLLPETRQRVQDVHCPHCKGAFQVQIETPVEEPVVWAVSQPHPLVPQMDVVRMFVIDEGIEVYSVSKDGKVGMRNLIPNGTYRLTEEAMPLDVFIQELSTSEASPSDGLPDDEEEEEEQVVVTSAPAAANGQANP